MTSRWGPVYWKYLHMIANEYPDNPNRTDINNHYALIQSFIHTIPCPKCKQDMRKLVNNTQLKIALQRKLSCAKYLWDIHNKVNKKLGKPLLSFHNFKGLYNQSRPARYWVKHRNAIKNILICILLATVVFLYTRRC